MKKLLLTLAFLFSSFISFSQYIEGKVLDANTNKPIEGVNVFMKGINRGTLTNAKGNYYLKFPYKIIKSDVIRFSHVAYGTLEIPFTSKKNNYPVYLLVDVKKLKEIKITEKRNLKKSIPFKKLSSMKLGLHDFGSFLNNGKIYVLGGDGSEREDMFLKTLEYYPDINDFDEFLTKANRFHSFSKMRYYGDLQIYDIKSNTWTKSNLKLRKRAYNNANFYNNKIYVLGGKNLSRHGRYFNEYLDDKIEIVDIKKGTVTIDNTNPHQAVNFASFTYKDNIIVVGGSIKLKNNGIKNFTNKVHLYNLKTGLWYDLATMPIAKEVNGVLINNTIYLIGGFNNKPLSAIETYNITTGKWKKEGELFQGIARPAITYNKNFIYIYDNGKIYTYNIKTKELKEYYIDLHQKAAQLYYSNNKLYILGGFKSTNYSVEHSNSLFSIDLNQLNLTKVRQNKTL
jgi:hypothetical protein